jgi:hypothetical protein
VIRPAALAIWRFADNGTGGCNSVLTICDYNIT